MDCVFHLSTDDDKKKNELLNNVANLLRDDTVEVENVSVVLNSSAVSIALEDSEVSSRIKKLCELGVEIELCSNSVESSSYGEEDFIDAADLVPSGVGRLNQLQDRGYNLVRV
ncbi:MAG: DsrE family protein [Candidatus Nanohaloarchaea archaeon]